MSTTHPFLRAVRVQRQDLSESYARLNQSADQLAAVLRSRVLYLEDDAHAARAVERQLRGSVEVFVARSVAEALTVLSAQEVDLLLTDSVGVPALPRLKALQPDLPVVVLSGAEAPVQLPTGVEAWYSKPLDGDQLRDVISTYAKGLLE